jgi:hypothetical protein
MAATKPIVAGKQNSWVELCSQVLGPVGNVKVQRIGSLWGGYGSVTEVSAESSDGSCKQHRLIAKQVRGRLLQQLLAVAVVLLATSCWSVAGVYILRSSCLSHYFNDDVHCSGCGLCVHT